MQNCAGAYLNPSFCNGDSLLLHGLMNSDLILDIHLVKFIDAADPIVCQHESTCLNAELVAVCLLQGLNRRVSVIQQPARYSTLCTSEHLISNAQGPMTTALNASGYHMFWM